MEDKAPQISVLMPAYNAEKYIGEAIESILSQSYENFELIIADDSSTDGTWGIVQAYVKKDERIIAVKNEKNFGIAGNRNILVAMAKGRYIAWQDADDISLPDRLAHQYDFMEKNREVGICGGWLHIFNDRGSFSIRRYKEKDEDIRKTIFRFSPVAQPGAMLRRRVLSDIGCYDLNYPPAEDLDMSFRIGRHHKFANLQEIVLRYRENHTGATFTKLRTIELKTLSIRLRYVDNNIYQMSSFDHLYNVVQYISSFVIPAKIKIWLFNLFRNSKI